MFIFDPFYWSPGNSKHCINRLVRYTIVLHKKLFFSTTFNFSSRVFKCTFLYFISYFLINYKFISKVFSTCLKERQVIAFNNLTVFVYVKIQAWISRFDPRSANNLQFWWFGRSLPRSDAKCLGCWSIMGAVLSHVGFRVKHIKQCILYIFIKY